MFEGLSSPNSPVREPLGVTFPVVSFRQSYPLRSQERDSFYPAATDTRDFRCLEFYDCIVAHRLTDLLDVKTLDGPRLLVIDCTLGRMVVEQ